MSHTPTPWLWRKADYEMVGWFGGEVFWVPPGTYQGDGDIHANAEFIVKAVNAYDRLIAFLKSERAGEIGEGYPPTDWDRVQRIDDLLRELGE